MAAVVIALVAFGVAAAPVELAAMKVGLASSALVSVVCLGFGISGILSLGRAR
jgi:hypothetical protein